MRIGKTLLLSVAGSALIATGAMAADPILPAPPPVVAAPPPAPGFDWAGPYVGAQAGVFLQGGFDSWTNFVQAGYNVVFNRVLVGVDGQLGHYFVFSPFATLELFGALNVRLGGLATDQVVPYAEAGLLYDFGAGLFWTAGGGLEFAVGNAVSLFGEAFGLFAGGYVGTQIQFGVNWHPGN